MGTRNLTQVIFGGKIRLSHYAQFDGYFESAGKDQLAFLNGTGFPERFGAEEPTGRVIKFERTQFIANLNKLKVLNDTEAREDTKNPYLERVCSGANALAGIQSGNCKRTWLDLKFPYDSLFCEYLYLLDLDKNVWEVYLGFNSRKLAKTARFYAPEPDQGGYYGVRLWETIPLNRLPKTMDKLIKRYKKERQ